MTEQEPIAVVGMAGRFPEARDVEEFWENLVEGRECMTDLSVEEVLARGESPERVRHPHYVLRRPLLPDMEYFDAEYFGMTPREAELRDPQHRIFLEVCHAALEHAGYDPWRCEAAIGLYAGVNGNRYVELHLRRQPGLPEAVGELALETSNHPDYVTTFTSYKLGLRGPSMTVATACSSSLVSVHQACQALRNGECDMALAGGVEVEWPYGFGYVHSPGGIYPSDGYCRPFDVAAEGTVFGSGAGVVVLKRYADALADRDTVYALVLGSAVNNDGADKVGFSAPSVSGQAACVAEALASGGVDPRTVSYVEAHGTATRLGDLVEVSALTRAYRAVGGDVPTGYCGIGSVKSNIGHLGPASGVAGLIKTVLALHRETIPPSINFTSPNPDLKLDQTPFTVVDTLRPWERDGSGSRRAGVSSFGIGGTNAHVVLEEAPPAPTPRADAPQRPELLVVSARTAGALGRYREELARHLAWHPSDPADAAHTLYHGRRPHAVRDAVVAATAEEAVQALSDRSGPAPRQVNEVVLAFPGQGSQRLGMARGLHAHVEAFRTRMDQCLRDFSDLLGRDLVELWHSARDEAELAETVVAQPLLFSVEYALAEVLREAGVPVSAVLGHSLGEITAATVAGVFTRDAALHVVAERAKAMQRMPAGAMAAVSAAESDVAPHLDEEVGVAAVNAPRQVVISGGRERVAAVLERLAAAGVNARLLRTSHAYHSALMREAVEPFREAVAAVERARPSLTLVSCATGSVVDEAVLEPSFWADQLVSPVRFADAATALLTRREHVAVLEAGPGTTLTELLKGNPAVRRGRALPWPTLPRGESPTEEYAGFLRTLADLWRGGLSLDLGPFLRPDARRVALPGYPFERTRHYVDHPVQQDTSASAPPVSDATPPPTPPPSSGQQAAPAGEPVRDAEPADTVDSVEPVDGVQPVDTADTAATGPELWELTWTRTAPPTPPDATGAVRGDRALVVLPEQEAAARRVLTLVQRSGLRPLRVRLPGASGGVDPRVDLLDRDAVLRFVGTLAREGRLPDTVVYAPWCTPEAGAVEDASAAVVGLTWLLQAVQRYRGEAGLTRLRLTVLTQHGVDVSGGEPLVPARAVFPGLLRTIELEVPQARCRLLDIGERSASDTVVSLLRDGEPRLAAVRGTDVWVPAVRPLPRRQHPATRLRRRGVYLVTGGLGGLGRVSAQALADTGVEPRLVLLGRSVAVADDGTPRDPETRAFVAELTASGAEVEVLAADVADEAGLREVVARVRQRFGPVNGVLHAAGVAGDGLLELRTREQIDGVLRPKVTGAEVLHRVLAEEAELDFVVHYGSRAALTGLVGSGDYAAANGYLNALAVARRDGDCQVVSVNWPGWAEVGMAVRGSGTGVAATPVDPEVTVVDTVWDGSQWFLDEHRIAGLPVLPGTGYLDLAVTAAVRRGLVPEDRPLSVTDLAFTSPLTVTPGTTVRVAYRPDGADRFAVTVSSAPATEAGWTEHAQAVLAVVDEEPRRVDLGEWTTRLAEAPTPPTVSQGAVVSFGPRWDAVRALARVDAGDTSDAEGAAELLLAELSLSEEFRDDLAEHRAHPALLDLATSLAQTECDTPHLPFHYREVVLFRSLPADLVAVARPTGRAGGTLECDVTLYDLRGREVARVTGFTMRQVDPETFTARVGTRAARDGDGDGEATSASPDATPDATPLLSPVDGAALLRRVLDTPTPSAVVVLRPGEVPPGHVVLDDRAVPQAPAEEPPPPTPSSEPSAPSPVATVTASATTASTTGTPTAAAAATAGGEAGGDTVEQRLRELWEQLTGLTDIGPEDDFFEIGGNSLAAVQLVSRIRETFGVQLSVGHLYETGRLRQLASVIRELTE